MAHRTCTVRNCLASTTRWPISRAATIDVNQTFVRRAPRLSTISFPRFNHPETLHHFTEKSRSQPSISIVKTNKERRRLSTLIDQSELLSGDAYEEIPTIKFSTDKESEGINQIVEFLSEDTNTMLGPQEARSINGNVVIKPTLRSQDVSSMTVTVTINNPKKLNSLTTPIISDLTTTFKAIGQVPQARVVILRGRFDHQRPSFCSGANLSEMSQINTPQEAESFIRKVSGLCTAIRDCPAVVIAFIDGHCYGAGLEVAASCDVRYATNRSTFSMPEVKVGVPSVVEARMLADIIGWARMRTMVIFAQIVSARDALFMGLIEKVPGIRHQEAVRGKMLTAVDQIATEIMETTGAQAMRAQKVLMRQWENLGVDDGIEASITIFKSMWADGGSEPKEFMQRAMTRIKEAKAAKAQASKAPSEQPKLIPHVHVRPEREEDRIPLTKEKTR